MLNDKQQKALSKALIVGLGKTGLSCARFLSQQGLQVAVTDSREAPPALEALRESVPNAAVFLGGFDEQVFEKAETLILSPGVSPKEPLVARAIARGVPVIGDIELFARYVQAPVIGITGSNGKSTVTTLVSELVQAAGYQVAVGGNLGTPALDLLAEGVKDFYVLELSSFQLETTSSLNCVASVVLNISPDHIDRHGSLASYTEAKTRIYRGAGAIVINDDEPALISERDESTRKIYRYGLSGTDLDVSVKQEDGVEWICEGEKLILPTGKIKLQGRHNLSNVLAALCLLRALDIPLASLTQPLMQFAGLPHRMQFVSQCGGVTWINDSKATNVGATIAALSGLPGRVVLIAGGQGKGGDFDQLVKVVEEKATSVVLMGEDAQQIEKTVADIVPVKHVKTMVEAVKAAAKLAKAGDIVLLSPACASFDMFKGYADRGDAFISAVQLLCEEEETV